MRTLNNLAILLITCLWTVSGWSASLKVEINGLDAKLRDHVSSYLDIVNEQGKSDITPARIQYLNDSAVKQIKSALQVYGFYHAKVKAELQEDNDNWTATYTVDPGSPTKITSVDVSISGDGQNNPAIKAVLNNFPIIRGQIFEHPRYDQARDELLRVAIEQGFLDAEYVKHEVKVDIRKYTASVILQLDTHHRYAFGTVHYNQTGINETYLRRYLTFKVGEPYNNQLLAQYQTRLSDTGLFQSVDIKPVKSKAKNYQVPIDVTLTERDKNQWRFGLGYATDTGPRASINYSHIVGSKGKSLDSKILYSTQTKKVSTGLTIPLTNPQKDQATIGAHYSEENTQGRNSRISGVSVSRSTFWGEWQRIYSLNYDREIYTIDDEPQQRQRALYPLISFTRIRTDNRIYTHNGSRIYLEMRGANMNVFSDTNYLQTRAGIKWIKSFSDDSRILFRTDLGSTDVRSLDNMPLSQRFFAGGDNSVRGYGYQELGPRDSRGNVVGGKHLIVGSIELEKHFTENWSIAAFYDVGNAINSISDPLYVGKGWGIRWKSPVGPIRFDVGFPESKGYGTYHFHVVIGPDL